MFKEIYKLIPVAVLITGCDAAAESSSGIEGMYVTQTSNEYSITWDTVHITAISKKSGTYFIHHKAGYQRIRDGKLKSREQKETSLVGSWYEERRQLKTEKLGRVYSFPENGKTLLMGTIPYTKIRQ